MKDEKKRYQLILVLQVSSTDFEQSLFLKLSEEDQLSDED